MAYYPGISHRKAEHPEYSTIKSRLQTFDEDNDFFKSLAKAGFCKKGYYGCVECFFCGVSIRGIKPGDNVWAQHAESFPDCEYLKLHKGEKFIQKARDMGYHNDNRKLEEEKDLESIDTDQMIEDLNSRASQMMMDEGYTQEEVEQAVFKAREKHGNGELRAHNLLACLLDNKSIKTPAKIFSTASPISTRKHETKSLFTFPNTEFLNTETTEGLDKEQKKLVEENRELKSRRTCKVCLDSEACTLFMPCRHMVSCMTCARKLESCPVCRAEVVDKIQTYTG